jgi:hypothetical protein
MRVCRLTVSRLTASRQRTMHVTIYSRSKHAEYSRLQPNKYTGACSGVNAERSRPEFSSGTAAEYSRGKVDLVNMVAA